MTHTVTVGLDGSAASLAATDWAAREAASRAASLRLVCVRDNTPYPYAALARTEADFERARRVCREAADRVALRWPELGTSTQTPAGRPPSVLAEASEESELLVLGTRAMGRLRAHLVGSVALRTVPHAACPVVLVRAGTAPEGPAGDGGPAGRVVLGLGDGDAPADVVGHAFGTAARWGSPLLVLHVRRPSPLLLADVGDDDGDPEGAGATGVVAAELAERLLPWREKYPDVPVTARTVTGSPAERLVEAAETAALVVVGRRVTYTGPGAHVGPVAQVVMHHATAPVAVVPHR
ncbi:universal stress protein [Streptomyces chumphonensis]|uniref:Universal stress protein n=1 Tax=Streptomyces chumphonensis TaxID=1214925 RepID=A0A927F1H6_9ACTN|nr:universal stress protein [Streptomyces chumphonensis]MBD3932617.1 universal stress protein [Streptomyces chumphonensis]